MLIEYVNQTVSNDAHTPKSKSEYVYN